MKTMAEGKQKLQWDWTWKLSGGLFHNRKRTAVWSNEMEAALAQWGFPSGSDGKEFACNAGDLGLIPGSGRDPGEGNGNPL